MTAYIRHTGGPQWGAGVLVAEHYDQRTYLFADGVKRTFKTAVVTRFIEPAPTPTDEDRARLSRGLAAGGVATPIAINLELEAEIRKNPEDPAPYIVYADWLQQRKDPRGELITVHEQLARDPGNKKLRAAEAALFDAHGTYFMPEALHHALRSPRRAGDDPATRCGVGWHMGFIESARLARKPRQQLELTEIATQLAGHPSASFLREIVLGPLGDADGFDYAPLLAAFAARPLPVLESLVVGDFTADHLELRFARAGDLCSVLAAASGLRKLVVRAGSLQFSTPPPLAQLRELRLFTELAPADRERVLAAHMPELETRELGGDRVKLRARDVQTLAANASLGRLRELVIRRSEGTQTISNALIAAPELLARLDTLVLADGDLGDKAVDKLARHAAKLAHLDTLDLSGNPLSPASALQLTRLAGAVATPRVGTLDEAMVMRRTNDPRNAAAARELADPARWLALGRDSRRVWGEHDGRDHYYVFAHLDDRRCGCSCGSPRSPCKHALALLILAARNHPFPDRPPTDSLLRHAAVERPRYWSAWE